MISGNGLHGVRIAGGTNTEIRANRIGTTPDGTSFIRNLGSGISVEAGSTGTRIGFATTTNGDRNVISGNFQAGIAAGAVSGLVIQGNLIGLSANGANAVPNLVNGITILGATSPQIGGTDPGAGNFISGNTGHGLRLVNPVTGALVQGNLVGLPVGPATISRPNSVSGLTVENATAPVTVGGSAAARNVVSALAQPIGIQLINATKNAVISSNYIGPGTDGVTAVGNTKGVYIDATSTVNTVGGTATADRNVFFANTVVSIQIDGNSNKVYGNWIGVDALGNAASSGMGIAVNGNSNLIGDTAAGAGNVISSASGAVTGNGVHVGGSGNKIVKNLIGVDPTGLLDYGNESDGIMAVSATTLQIVGNVVSKSGGNGIRLNGGSFVTIKGNSIGLGSDSDTPLGNALDGILTDSSAANVTIGGSNAGDGNIISSNGGDGIHLTDQTDNTTIQGNTIGLNLDGDINRGNGGSGIAVYDSTNTFIGGTTTAERNVISGNGEAGIEMKSGGGPVTEGGLIQMNYIGTDRTGVAPIPNEASGILLEVAFDITIGGATSVGNVISGNGEDGIAIVGNNSETGHVIQGNRIGVGATGAALGNGGWGISIANARDVTIGPADPTTSTLFPNEIANNGADATSTHDDGVNVSGSQSETIQIRGNSIFSNVGLGIRLQDNSNSTVPGVSVPPPSINVDNSGGVITATGTINAAQAACVATSTCTVDIYVADSGSEGMAYKATQENVGAGGYSIDLSTLVSPHQFITATTTDDGNTSQFQNRFEVPDDGSS